MILLDTSAWVEYDRATGSPVHLRARELIERSDLIGTTEPVIMEVLSGARDDPSEGQLRRLLRRFELLSVEPQTDFEAASRIYRLCRNGGVTPRGLIDCLIAAVAMRREVAVLAHDRDFARMADVVALGLDPASLRP